MDFITLDTIVNDILFMVRGSKVSQSETISKRQVEAWVHQYRAVLLKRDIDKNKVPNPDYIQTIPSLSLEVVDKTEDSINLESETYYLRTKLELPNTVDFNTKPGFTYVGTSDGKELQFVSEGRAPWQQYKRFTSNDSLVFLRDKKLYVNNVSPLSELTVRGIFEIPTDVSNFINANSTVVSSELTDRYPIPATLVPALKEMLLANELGIIIKTPSDNTNDGANKVSANEEAR